MKSLAILALALLASSCSRKDASSNVAPPVDASAPVIASSIDASVTVLPDGGVTLDTYCGEITAFGESPEGIMCRGERVRPSCSVKEVRALPTLGKIVLVDERVFEGTHAMLVLVDSNGHFTILERVLTEECDLGDPADVSIELVSAIEGTDAGPAQATIVFDTLRNDPPFQGGARILSAERRSVHCHAGLSTPVCDKPATLGTYSGPAISDKPPPFSKWKHGE